MSYATLERNLEAAGQEAMDEVRGPGAARLHALEQMRLALRGLPEPDQKLIQWIYWGGLTELDLAEQAGIPYHVVKARHQGILKSLRATMGVRPPRPRPAPAPMTARGYARTGDWWHNRQTEQWAMAGLRRANVVRPDQTWQERASNAVPYLRAL